MVRPGARAASGPSRPIPGRSTPRRPTSWPRPAWTGSAWVPSRSSPTRSGCSSGITAGPRWNRPSRSSRPRFPRWSLDLIFGVPGSTLDDWRRDLEIALGFGPSHLSCYGLVFEKGTAALEAARAGEVRPLDEEVERSMYEATIDRLAECRPGDVRDLELRPARATSRGTTWSTGPTTPISASASARRATSAGVRSVNTRDLPAYLRRIEAGEPATGPERRADARGAGPRDADPHAPPDRDRPRPRRLPAPDRLRHRRSSPARPSSDTGPRATSRTTGPAAAQPRRASSWPTGAVRVPLRRSACGPRTSGGSDPSLRMSINPCAAARRERPG